MKGLPLSSNAGAASSCAKHARRVGYRKICRTGWVTLDKLKRDIDRGWKFFFHKRHLPLPKVLRISIAGQP